MIEITTKTKWQVMTEDLTTSITEHAEPKEAYESASKIAEKELRTVTIYGPTHTVDYTSEDIYIEVPDVV